MEAKTVAQARTDALDIRVEDYLDDKLQSTTDLESIDTLIALVEEQSQQLQSQLDNAIKELEDARHAAEDRHGFLLDRVQGFQKLQDSIDIRVKIAAQSDAPNRAIARLQAPMKKLQTVDLARNYLLLLQDVEAWRKEARTHLPESPKAALEPYTKLKRLATRMRELQRPADDAATHLVNYVAQVTDSLWDEMKKTMSGELEAILAERSWPMVDPQSEMDEAWLLCFEKLLDLQVPEILYSVDTVTLFPFEVMCKIFVAEFRFHFLSDKPTSKAEAVGTHCFPWFLATVQKWEDFFRDNLGLLLIEKLRDTPAAHNLAYVDPVSALVTALLPVMREKVKAVAAEAVRTPTLLSSFMGQLMTFDENVRAKFNYDGGDAESGWPGLTSEILSVWFEPWFQAERAFALERFQTIMATPDARNIDYDYGGPGRTKPTHGAVRVTDLLRSVTTQYERLRNFPHKLRFLIGIQLDILDEYHDRLRGSLEAYQATTSTVGRTLHGVTKEQQAALEGTGAFETLCKVFGSADHIVTTLNDWGNEDFFVTLWDQLQAKAKNSDSDGSSMAGTMTYDEVKDRTSSAVGSDHEEGILFDETIAAYAARRQAAQELLIGALHQSHQKAFKAYVIRTQWTTISDNSAVDASQMAVTPELDEPLRILKRNLDFVSKVLGTAVHRRTWRETLERLNDLLWNEVLMRQQFTAHGAAQFMRDLNAVFALIERYMPNGVVAMTALQEGVTLLNAPLATARDQNGEDQNNTVAVITLKEASDRLFTDNTEAKKLLEEMEMEMLTPANGRLIVQKRVENRE